MKDGAGVALKFSHQLVMTSCIMTTSVQAYLIVLVGKDALHCIPKEP